MQMAATTSSAMLSGQVATPLSVAGVTPAPSRMPTSTKHRRASGSGICMGRPASAATATVNIEPETRPPGKPTRVSPTPPNAAISSVSATGTSLLRGGRTRGIQDFRALGPHDPGVPLAAFAEINAAQSTRRQIPRRVEGTGSDVNLRRQFAECRGPLAPAAPVEPSTAPWPAERAGPSVDILGGALLRKTDAAA